jgi:hypothetical protein
MTLRRILLKCRYHERLSRNSTAVWSTSGSTRMNPRRGRPLRGGFWVRGHDRADFASSHGSPSGATSHPAEARAVPRLAPGLLRWTRGRFGHGGYTLCSEAKAPCSASEVTAGGSSRSRTSSLTSNRTASSTRSTGIAAALASLTPNRQVFKACPGGEVPQNSPSSQHAAVIWVTPTGRCSLGIEQWPAASGSPL